MNPAFVIARKRDGMALDTAEIRAFIAGFADGTIPDYQMSALAMAIYLRGMNDAETQTLTAAMLASGTTLRWSTGGRPKVDKHSTGGLGDKVSLILAPLLACCGVDVPMISGRGLGATGGTLDKLESIEGFRTNLSLAEIQRQTEQLGCVITGASAELAPADRKLYALRDVTATVASIPLITASIMSKKLAESLDALVLDVKFGSGAFMKSLADARTLARSLVATGHRMGVATTALLTDMNQPLGRMVGNAVEVHEAVAALQGGGPLDLWNVTRQLGVELLVSARVAATVEQAGEQLDSARRSGRAFEAFARMVQAQGGDLARLGAPAPAHELPARADGFVWAIDAERLGNAVIELGGGRRVMHDPIDPAVGLEMLVRIGDRIDRDQPLVRVFARRSSPPIDRMIEAAIMIAPAAPPEQPLVADRIAHL